MFGAPLVRRLGIEPIYAQCVGVMVGGLLQLAIQFPALRRIGMLPRLHLPWECFADAGVKRILRQMLPAIFAVSVAQISLIINTNIASHLGAGSNSWLYYADRLMELPTALLGVAIGTVLLPSLSSAYAADASERYQELLDWGLRLTCLLALPCALGLAMLADGLIGVLFLGGQFRPEDVHQSAVALQGYSVGLVGLIGVKILAPGFYARQDIRTPVRFGIAVLVATQLANVVLVPRLAHAGLALSIGLGAIFNVALLLNGLMRRNVYRPSRAWLGFGLRLAVSLGAMAAALGAYLTLAPYAGYGTAHLAARVLWLAGAVGTGVLAYFLALGALGFRPRDFRLVAASAAASPSATVSR